MVLYTQLMFTNVTLLFPPLWVTVSAEAKSTFFCKETVVQPGANQAMLRQGSQCLPLHHMSLKESYSNVHNITYLFILAAHNSTSNKCFACTVASKNITRYLDSKLHTLLIIFLVISLGVIEKEKGEWSLFF